MDAVRAVMHAGGVAAKRDVVGQLVDLVAEGEIGALPGVQRRAVWSGLDGVRQDVIRVKEGFKDCGAGACIAGVVTPGPFSTTMPAASCPSTIGNGIGQSPFMMCQSLMHTPAALTCTRTSFAFGGSCSRSRICRGLLTSVSTAARMSSSPCVVERIPAPPPWNNPPLPQSTDGTGSHLARSPFTNAVNSSGVAGDGRASWVSNCFFSPADRSVLIAALRSLASTSARRPAGAIKPYQLSERTVLKPGSPVVGTDKASEREVDATASALIASE